MFRTKGETFFFRLRKEGELLFAEVVMLAVKESCKEFIVEVSIFNPESQICSSATFVPRPAGATNDGEGCLTVHQKTLATIWKHNVEMKSYEFQLSIKVDGPELAEEDGSEEDTDEEESDISDGETEWLLESNPSSLLQSPWPEGWSVAKRKAYLSHLSAHVKRKRERPGCKKNVLPDRPGYEMLHVDAPFKETLVLLGMYVDKRDEEDENYVEGTKEANGESSDESSSSEEEDANKKTNGELPEDEGAFGRLIFLILEYFIGRE